MTKDILLALALALALVACGDDPAATIDAGIDASADASSPDAAVDAPTIREGNVTIAETHLPSPGSISLAFATFVDGRLLVPVTTAGGCTVYEDTPASSLDAGTLTITGTTTPITMTQSAAGEVYAASEPLPEDVFAADTALTVAATGGAVAAFSGTVTTPQPLAQIVFPATLSRTAAADVTWTAGSAPEIMILVTAGTGAMLCTGTDTGSFTITTAAIALLPSAATQVSLGLYRVHTSSLTAGGFDVTLRAMDAVFSGTIAITP